MSTRCVLLLTLLILGSTDARLTGSEERKILQYHNYARSRVGPKAANMVALEWDDDLAERAQEWADSCTFGHNPERTNDDGEYVGENLAGGSQGITLKQMVSNWEGEKVIYDYASNTCHPKAGNPLLHSCGHYTQMVWADTKKIGCGFKSGCPGAYSNILVCNYFNAGNWRGEKPYESGRKCSQCPKRYKQCDDRLCVRG